MKKIFLFFNIILAVIIFAFNMCYAETSGLWLKGITSGLFVVLGLLNLIYVLVNKTTNKKFPILLVISLTIAMLGDIILNIHFLAGAIIFAIGHVFYLISYCFISRFRWLDIIIAFAIFIPSMLIIVLLPMFDFGGIVMEIVCVVYALIISFMLGKAISNFIKERSITNFFILLGSFLFFFSDLMLLFDVFANVSIIFDTLCLATYYTGQTILASSIFVNHTTKQQ